MQQVGMLFTQVGSVPEIEQVGLFPWLQREPEEHPVPEDEDELEEELEEELELLEEDMQVKL